MGQESAPFDLKQSIDSLIKHACSDIGLDQGIIDLDQERRAMLHSVLLFKIDVNMMREREHVKQMGNIKRSKVVVIMVKMKENGVEHLVETPMTKDSNDGSIGRDVGVFEVGKDGESKVRLILKVV